MIYFLQTHLYIVIVPVLLLLIALRLLTKRRKTRREFEEMSQFKRRDEALAAALRNPQVKEERGGPERPMEISWDDKAVNEKEKKDASIMVELVELSAYSRRKYVYRLNRPVQIGSGKGNHMELLREGVAEKHCEIFLNGNKVCARSCPGAKTLLKRGKTSALISSDSVYLNNGDHIQLGTAEIQFRFFKG